MTFAWFYGGAGWNQDAHFDLTRALVERQTLYIDGYDVNTGDVSRGTGGHTYINKAPGLSFLAAIPYAAVYAVERALQLPVDGLTRANAWIVSAFTCGLSGALIGVVLYFHGRRRAGASVRISVAVAVSILFGTIVFPYATMLFAHVPAALFVLLAVTLLDERPLLAGIAAGLAVTCFYVCAVVPAVLAVLALRRKSWSFFLGAAPFAVALGLYHWACFGSPFATAVEASTPFTEPGRLFGVLGRPSLEALYGITLSPYRGLFFASPVLLVAFFARWRWHIAAIVIAFLLVIASFNGWNGGWAFGPRYLLPIVPLFATAMFSAVPRARSLFLIAAVLSIATHFLVTATDAMPSPDVHNPVRDYLLPAFVHGEIPDKTRAAFPWYATTRVDPVSLPREATNVGELLFGEGARMSIAPVLLWWAVAAATSVCATLTRD